ncbi:CLPTM1-like membrane protein cnrB [Dichanthelium oligosanthes]|uniref:CLPTM1-like membrane protein cnrB n=1 Tax=Dichanthelium oligosanthes TaxID=888268 RepID=A0A1E5V782_9POAL|nr:CLPTM1-like membrane protein cnrB [Dichanthelium oligosanthes]
MSQPAAAVDAAAQPQGRGPAGRQGGGGGLGQSIAGIVRMAVFWYFAAKFFGPKRPPAEPGMLMSNLFQKGEAMDMWMYLSENEKFNDFANDDALIWHETNIPYAVWGPTSTRTQSLTYNPSEALKHNGSLYAHVYFARSGYPVDPSDPEYEQKSAFGRTHPVVAFLPKSKAGKKKSLLGDSEEPEKQAPPKENKESEDKDEGPTEYISYWKPNVFLYDRDTDLNVDPATGDYYPTVFFNEFWLLRDKLIALNETVEELPLNLEVGPISMTKWQLFLQIEQSFQVHRSYGSMLEGEADELKRVFLEGNPYLLGLTMVVSLFHSLFDFLAFKNDIQFWNKNKSMEGLSAKSVVLNFVCQLVVFLYLLDNDTSWMILASSGIGVCIEFWKIGKAMHIEIDRSGKFPMLRFRDRESYAQNKTKEYDAIAMKYLTYVLFLLVIGFSIYSLKYEKHKSWYSWILSSMTSCVYMFGFIMMCPQLFINYKLKSVAHMPWRQMTYKFLNTIIDDLFAFVIKMPILHRLSVFRDDVIFLIYLYQRWKYPVDKKRVNEFGFGGEDEPAARETLEGSDSAAAAQQTEAEAEAETSTEDKKTK